MFLKLFIFWLSVLPFFMWGGYYEEPKILLYILGVFATILFWVAKDVVNKITFKKSDLLFLGWVSVLLVSSIFGSTPLGSIAGVGYRHQGVVFFFALWIIGKTIETLKISEKSSLGTFLAWMLVGESIYVLAEAVSGRTYFGYPLGTLGESNAVAGIFAIGSYFVFEYISPAFLLGLTWAVAFLGSGSGLTAFVLSLGKRFVGDKKWFKWGTGIVVATSVVLLGVFFFRSQTSSIFESRTVIWNLGIKSVLEKPFLGYGAESGEEVFKNAFYGRGFPLVGLTIERSHNLFLDVAMWSGIIGLLIFAYYIYSLFWEIPPGKRFALLAFLVYSMFQPLGVSHWVLLTVILNI